MRSLLRWFAMRLRPFQGLANGLACVSVLALLMLATPPRAEGAEFMLSVMQDDNQLVYGSGAQRENALTYMRALGVDAVRVTVLWQAAAPRRKLRNGANPAAYPRRNWDRYDELVKSATSRGLLVYFSVTAPGPAWAHAKSPDRANQRTWKPNPREFGKFFRALGRRYSGRYRDENAGRAVLPRVSWWGLFNEPNQGGWLTPQAQELPGVRGVVPTSPALYRELLVESARALIATGHQDDLALMGETAPLGVAPENERRPLRPAEFLRELFCLDNRLRRFRGRRAKARSCQRVGRLAVLKKMPRLAYGHHPYTKDLPPTEDPSHRDAISIANIKTLPALLDKIAARTRLIPSDMGVFLTEFGYESNPPDPINGVDSNLHAEYLNVGDYIAYRNPRVFANTQFQLFDVPPQTRFPRDTRQYWFTYQSGLFKDNGEPKPAASAYVMPFEARSAGGEYLFWGQVRHTPNGIPQTVYLQAKDAGGNWQTVGDPVQVSNAVGFWDVTRPALPGQTWRVAWGSADGADIKISREITLR